MKFLHDIFLFTVVPVILFSCSLETFNDNLEEKGENGYTFSESRKQWKKLKGKNGNSYEYVMLEQSFTGFGSETTITVKKGKVISRLFHTFIISDEDGTKTLTFVYSEDRESLGTHEEGALPVTIDELYKTCLSQYLIADPETNTVYFDTNEEGVISLCGYVPVGCQDDCFTGITISSFNWISRK